MPRRRSVSVDVQVDKFMTWASVGLLACAIMLGALSPWMGG